MSKALRKSILSNQSGILNSRECSVTIPACKSAFSIRLSGVKAYCSSDCQENKVGEIHTPIPDSFLDGITRREVIKIAKAKGIKVIERKIKPEELKNFVGCFLTGTAAEIQTVRKINRTKDRPIASGEITTAGAVIFLLLMLIISLFCLVQLNTNTWLIALASIPLIIIYPLAKKFTKWPQIFLGLTFSWAVPTAWSAANQSWGPGIFTMYFATVFWIIGYDTIYGCQDRKEDEIIGVKNSAISAQNFLTFFVGAMYFFTFTLLIFSGWKLNANLIWFLGVFIIGIHFIVQIHKIKNLEMYNPLSIFKSNVFVGLILTVSGLGNYLDFI